MVEQASVSEYIWDSARETFETMIFLPIEPVEAIPDATASTALIGTITFTGPVQGAFSILCRLKGAEKIARAMLMLEPEDPLDEADMCDAFGELTNLLIGGIKTRLNEAAPNIKISIPTVTQGVEMRPFHVKNGIQTQVVAATDGEAMQMSMTYKMN